MMLKSVEDVVDALGGTKAASELAGVGVTAVLNWKARGSIATDKFLVINNRLASLGKNADPSLFGFMSVGEQ